MVIFTWACALLDGGGTRYLLVSIHRHGAVKVDNFCEEGWVPWHDQGGDEGDWCWKFVLNEITVPSDYGFTEVMIGVFHDLEASEEVEPCLWVLSGGRGKQ